MICGKTTGSKSDVYDLFTMEVNQDTDRRTLEREIA